MEQSSGCCSEKSEVCSPLMIEQLQNIRRGLRAAITRYESTLESVLDKADASELIGRLTSYTETKKKLSSVCEQLVPNLKSEDIEDFFVEVASDETRLNVLIAKVKSKTSQEAHGSASDSVQTGTSRRPATHLKMDRIKVEKFNGDYSKWHHFWDRFEYQYHTNPDVPNKIDKFDFLLNQLEGDAAAAVGNLSYSAGNYDEAICILKRRFGRKVPIINSHVNALLSLPLCENDADPKELRNLVDGMVSNVRALRNLGALGTTDADSEESSALLAPVLFSRLPAEFRVQWIRQHPDDEMKVSALLDFVQLEVEGRERSVLARTLLVSQGSQSGMTCDTSPEKLRSHHALERNTSSGVTGIFNASVKHKHRRSTSAFRFRRSNSSADSPPSCCFCEKQHHPNRCDKASTMTGNQCYRELKKSRRCFKCLSFSHVAKDCRVSTKCEHCQSRNHHSFICQKRSSVNSCGTSAVASLASSSSVQNIRLLTATLVALGPARKARVRVLFDSGSQRSFVSTNLIKQLGLKKMGSEWCEVQTLGGHSSGFRTIDRYEVILQSPLYPSVKMNIQALEQDIINTVPQPPADLVEVSKYAHLRGLEFADTATLPTDNHILEVLIGMDFYFRIFDGEIRRGGTDVDPIAVGGRFGWILAGPEPGRGKKLVSSGIIIQSNLSVVKSDKLDHMVQQFWELESMGISADEVETRENDLVLRRTEDSVSYDGERYQVRLPWRDGHPPLQNNRLVVQARLSGLMRKLHGNTQLKKAYSEVLQDYEEQGIIEKICENEEDEGKKVFYLPHRPVIKENSQSTKVRPVFDASSRYAGVSLNDCLHVGPSLIPDILDVFMRFRMYPIAVSTDIKKAFLMINLHPEDRDACRFLWSDKNEPVEYRFRRICFGINASPFLLNFVVRHHLRLQEAIEPNLTAEMSENFYVDDLTLGGSNLEEAFFKSMQAHRIMLKAGMELCKFASNSSALRDQLRNENLSLNPDPVTKLLGIDWNTEQDMISLHPITLHPFDENVSKRFILSIVSKVFDPCGFFAPVVLRGKLLLQRLWEKKRNWDDAVEPLIFSEFSDLSRDLICLHAVEIPRYPFGSLNLGGQWSIHVFCDASLQAYSAVVYIRGESTDGRSEIGLLVCKCRVAPLKKLSLPCLELMGCLSGARLSRRVTEALHIDAAVFLYSDSEVALSWICADPQKLAIFVKNRVKEIRRLTQVSQWRHVRGGENPADIATRGGVSLSQLQDCSLWWKGPEWLSKSSGKWPTKFSREQLSATVTHVDVVSSQVMEVADGILVEDSAFDMRRFGSLRKALQVISLVLAARDRFMRRKIEGFLVLHEGNSRGWCPSNEEVRRAQVFLMRGAQAGAFSEEIRAISSGEIVSKRSCVARLGPALNEDGLLCSIGRTQRCEGQRPLILLPSESHVTRLVVMDMHWKMFHVGVSGTLAALRSHVWILKGRRTVKMILRECWICKRFNAPAYQQVESAIPEFRLTRTLPFFHTGIDYVGPIMVKEGKVYICLFTCCVTRGIHLELVNDMSLPSFLQCFRRFVSRRGGCGHIISDNAKTFRAAAVALRGLVCWRFIPERAPWWGGFWERMVRCVKVPLRKVLGTSFVDVEELRTLLVEVEFRVNCRPLTYVPDEREDPVPLRPVDFMMTPSGFDEDRVKSDRDCLLGERRLRVALLEEAWERWAREYLHELREWSRVSCGVKKSATVGDVVLVDPFTTNNRALFPLGRVTGVITGKDGVVRAAFVKCRGQIFRRSTRHLYPLEVVDSQIGPEVHPEIADLIKQTDSSQQVHRPKKVRFNERESTSNKIDSSVKGMDFQMTRAGRVVHPPERFGI